MKKNSDGFPVWLILLVISIPIALPVVLAIKYPLEFAEGLAESAQEREHAIWIEQNNARKKIIASVEYVRDPRSGICFACSPMGYKQVGKQMQYQGTNVVSVPCSTIPPEFLEEVDMRQ